MGHPVDFNMYTTLHHVKCYIFSSSVFYKNQSLSLYSLLWNSWSKEIPVIPLNVQCDKENCTV